MTRSMDFRVLMIGGTTSPPQQPGALAPAPPSGRSEGSRTTVCRQAPRPLRIASVTAAANAERHGVGVERAQPRSEARCCSHTFSAPQQPLRVDPKAAAWPAPQIGPRGVWTGRIAELHQALGAMEGGRLRGITYE